MFSRKLASKYAKALFAIKGSKEEIQMREEKLQLLAQFIRTYPKVLHIFRCPEVTLDERMKILQKFFTKPLEQVMYQFIRCIFKNGRAALLMQIAAEYHQLVVDSLEAIDIEVATVQPLSIEMKSTLQTRLAEKLNKHVNLIEKQDPSLLGGFTLLMGNQFLDLSIKGKWKKLQQQLLRADT
jgi:F-type H+-transporting ATPase subunit delta